MADKTAYRLNITIYSTPDYQPINLCVKLDEYQARVLMATPVKSVGLAVQRAGGMILDSTPEPLEFHTRG